MPEWMNTYVQMSELPGAAASQAQAQQPQRVQAAQQQPASLQFKCAGVAHDPSSPFYKKSLLR